MVSFSFCLSSGREELAVRSGTWEHQGMPNHGKRVFGGEAHWLCPGKLAIHPGEFCLLLRDYTIFSQREKTFCRNWESLVLYTTQMTRPFPKKSLYHFSHLAEGGFTFPMLLMVMILESQRGQACCIQPQEESVGFPTCLAWSIALEFHTEPWDVTKPRLLTQ